MNFKQVFKIYLFSGCVFLLSTRYVFSQEYSYKAIIKDSIANNVLPFATIKIEHPYNNNLATNEFGEFTIKTKPIKLVFMVSYLGYDSVYVTREINQSIVDTIFLKQTSQILREIIVKGQKNIIQQEKDKLLVNVSETSLANKGSLFNVFTYTPFIQTGFSSIMFKGRKTRLYVDGKAVNNEAESLDALLTSMQSSTIDVIEIMTTPSPKYNANGGVVINIKTLVGKNLGNTYTLGLNYGRGRYNRFGESILWNNLTKKTSTSISLTSNQNKGFIEDDNNRSALGIDTKETFLDTRKRIYYNPKILFGLNLNEKNSFSVAMNNEIFERKRSIPGLTIFNDNKLVATQQSGTLDGNNFNSSLEYKFIRNKSSVFSISTDYSKYILENKDIYNENLEQIADIGTKQNINLYVLKSDFTALLYKGNFDCGLQYSYNSSNLNYNVVSTKLPVNPYVYDYSERINSGYFSYSNKFSLFEYSIGGRLEDTSIKGNNLNTKKSYPQNFTNFFPTASLNYSPSDSSIFTLSYSKSLYRQRFTELNEQVSVLSPYNLIIGNPLLKPALSNSFDFTYTINQTYVFTLSYLNTSNDFTVVPEQQQELFIYKNYNYRKYEWLLFDFTYNRDFTPWWNTSTGVEFYQTRNHMENLNGLSFQKGNTFYFFTNNYFTFKKGIKLDFSTFYLGKQVVGVANWKPYFRFNLSASKVISDKTTLSLSFNDLFNTFVSVYNVNTALLKGQFSNKYESQYVTISLSMKFGNTNVKVKQNTNNLEKTKNRISTN